MKLFKLLMNFGRGLVFLALIASTINGLANAGLIALIHTAIEVENRTNELLIAFAVLCVLFPFTRSLSEIILVRLSQKVTLDMRMDLSRQVVQAPLTHLEKMGAPRILPVLAEDIGAITGALAAMPGFCMQLTVIIGCLIYLAWLSLEIFVGTFIVILVVVGVFKIMTLKADPLMKKARDERDSLFKQLRGLTEGTKELKIHQGRRNSFFDFQLFPTVEAYKNFTINARIWYSIGNSAALLISFGMIGVLIFNTSTETNVLAGYILTLLYLAIYIGVLFSIPPTLVRANVALSKIEALGLNLKPEKTKIDAEVMASFQTDWKQLIVKSVVHAYHSEREEHNFQLGPIDLSLRPGELVFITGGNGSGKTTLAKLIIGLYIPESGGLVMDGKEIDENNREAFRQLFSVVFSDFHLFESLLGLGSTELDERAKFYLEKLELDHKVTVENGVLSTTALSQGQRKRLALLTAYLEDRPIYLFDEWAADQDPTFKKVFYHELLPELKERGKTVLVISHDDHYYDSADRVIKLADGKIDEII